MPTLNTEAPPAEAPAGGDFIKLEPFPGDDSYVCTIIAINFIPDYPFKRTHETTKEKYIKKAPGIEFFLGAMVGGKPYIAKTWAQQYSISDRANYTKYYTAATGKAPEAGSNANDLVGKFVLCEIVVEAKTSQKGKAYKATKIKSIGKVPKALAGECVPAEQFKAALEAALSEKEEAPF